MLGFDERRYGSVLGGAVSLRPQIEKLAAEIVAAEPNTLFLVGSGGSYAAMWPYEYLLTTRSALPVRSVIAAELVAAGNRQLTERSVVLLSSLSGTTRETVAAAEYCRARGVRTIGMTGDPNSPLAQVVDHVLVNPADDETASESYDIQLTLLSAAILHSLGEFDTYPRFAEQMDGIEAVLRAVQEQADPVAASFAARHSTTEYHMLVGSGPLWGFTYNYSMCILEEMQWLRTTRVHGAEFFHGSLELVERDTSLILFIGEDETRPLMDRVRGFAERYSDSVTVFDSADYALAGIDAEFRGLLGPLVMDSVTIRLSKHLEQVRDHPLDLRRYYRVVDY
ncbi:Fructoselysine-6-P-deglycase FrlB with duplicated sugar isomerase (SIS) domain [Geodermatophilus telluris]|uniref:Fructoselysine-6-P-deglycase FrlB with duplicated sugar isomerase (SIS) domain n=1 Tax=Geodermatophilus telluris TaxID=1190417 RepID=A0A1G6QLY4_9ACTN|nr:SIS domain-containing protein [Geodermatophilus telluris]SDC92726.1 Fructoselysine-6-P-deglycase FrlB with duplicated sugar isomerase (SIS) domain [Geodermatophilus telluris]